MNKLLILMGKSGVGKDTICDYLAEHYNFNKAITFTTRPMREHEKNGREYYFTTKNNFTDMIFHDEMIESRSYNTLVNNVKDTWFYGLHKVKNNIDFKKGNNIIVLDYSGAVNVVKYFGDNRCTVVYIDADEIIRKQRAKKRGSFDEVEWDRRVNTDNEDFKWAKIKDIVDFSISNNNKTIEEICKTISEEV